MNIVFKFVGGPNDGTVLSGRLGEPSDAERYFLFSNRGTVGYRLKLASSYAIDTLIKERLMADKPHPFQTHFYEVTDRMEDDDTVEVIAGYVPR